MTKDNNYSVEPVWDENDDLAEMMDAVLGRAEEFWSTIHQVKDGTLDASSLKTTSGFNPLCEHCLWNADCPKFKGNDHPEFSPELEELETWKSVRQWL